MKLSALYKEKAYWKTRFENAPKK